MGLFKNIFGRKKQAQSDDPMPQRPLNLQYKVVSENGNNFANQYVEAVKNNDEIELDYSVDSLDFVDGFLQRFSNEGLTVNDFAETIFVCGCYVGEVMIRNNTGLWINEEDAGLPEGVSMNPILVKLSNGNICDPVTKAFKRFHNGEVDSISYFYRVFTSN